MSVIKNLGQVRGYHIGDDEPLNKDIPWISKSSPRSVKLYNYDTSAWEIMTNQPVVYRFDTDLVIETAGIYLFHGTGNRTCNINDGISGLVDMRTTASGTLTLSGRINDNFIKTMPPGRASVVFVWDDVGNEYVF